ncbi:hypothetical protein [Cryobacterium sp.]|uniref:hypothetical protein n=1 Tax=Cryobacterium sp. TaxID=1926290 RepID=UPI00343D7894
MFSAPLGYLRRPDLVYRSRDVPRGAGSRAPRRGWEKSERPLERSRREDTGSMSVRSTRRSS